MTPLTAHSPRWPRADDILPSQSDEDALLLLICFHHVNMQAVTDYMSSFAHLVSHSQPIQRVTEHSRTPRFTLWMKSKCEISTQFQSLAEYVTIQSSSGRLSASEAGEQGKLSGVFTLN